jgi:hypothetical protein
LHHARFRSVKASDPGRRREFDAGARPEALPGAGGRGPAGDRRHAILVM